MATMKYATAFQASSPISIWQQVYPRPTASFNSQLSIGVRGNISTPCKFCHRFNHVGVRSIHNAICHRRIMVLFNTDQDDDQSDKFDGFQRNNKPSNKRRRKRDPIMGSINKDENVPLTLIESSAGFLFKRISLPSIGMFPGGEDTIDVPLVYILLVLGSAAIVPIVTWILLTAFFGLYLALCAVFMNEDDIDNNNQLGTEGEDSYNGIIPFAAFTGAIASAALISPEGLVSNTSFSLVSPVAIIALGLGGIAILIGVRNSREDEVRFEERDAREEMIREERRQMNLWDGEIQRSVDTTESPDERD